MKSWPIVDKTYRHHRAHYTVYTCMVLLLSEYFAACRKLSFVMSLSLLNTEFIYGTYGTIICIYVKFFAEFCIDFASNANECRFFCWRLHFYHRKYTQFIHICKMNIYRRLGSPSKINHNLYGVWCIFAILYLCLHQSPRFRCKKKVKLIDHCKYHPKCNL